MKPKFSLTLALIITILTLTLSPLGTAPAAAMNEQPGTMADAADLDLPFAYYATQVSSGWYHTCALTTNGTVRCWGRNDDGELGNNAWTDSHVWVDVWTAAGNSTPLSGIVSIVTGSYHTCALTSAGGVKCWGYNAYGQLGNGSWSASSTPVDVTGLTSGVVALAAGNSDTCALLATGGVRCWGYNAFGELGNNAIANSNVPVDVVTSVSDSTPLSDVRAIAAGSYHTCALTNTGSLLCWGYNNLGQLGINSTTDSHAPVNVVTSAGDSTPLSGINAISGGAYHTCALTTAGTVLCWGYNNYGQLGNNSTAENHAPVDVWTSSADSTPLGGVIAISTGESHTCALTSGGGVECWGMGDYGQIGTSSTTSTPVAVSGLTSGVSAVAAGKYHTCVVTTAGGVSCMGYNNYGGLGNNSTINSNTPVDVSGISSGSAVAISAGYFTTCAVTASGGVSCWGRNDYGQLGNNSTTESHIPVAVWTGSGNSTPLSGIRAVATGFYMHTCALTTAGGVKCWGLDAYGQLGNGVGGQFHYPVDVIGLSSGVSAIGVGEMFSCALTTAGGVKCWGNNQYGQLGNNSTTTSAVPVDVWTSASDSTPLSGVQAISVGGNFACALTTSGEVKCWGYNSHGQLGNNSVTESHAPVDVVTSASDSTPLSGVTAISAGYYHACAVTASGNRCWGWNFYGQLGNNLTADSSVPVDMTSLTGSVNTLVTGVFNTCALMSGGGAQCWGWNAYGEVGDNSTTDRPTPVSVAGLSGGVSTISIGFSHTCALTASGGVKCWGNNSYGNLGDNSTSESHVPNQVTGLLGSALTIVQLSADPVTAGSPTNFTATVSGPPVDSLTGTVQFQVDGTDLGSAVSLSGGSATSPSATLTLGLHRITAIYSGNSYYNLSRSASVVQAVTSCLNAITVTSNADSGTGSLRQAISDICPGGTIDFDAGMSGQTITLTSGQLSIDKSMTIDGLTSSPGVSVSGGNAVRVFYITGGTVVINNLTVENGVNVPDEPTGSTLNFGGAGLYIYNAGTSVTLNNCAVINNSLSSFKYGTAIITHYGTDLTLNNCTVSGNSVGSGADVGGILSLGTTTINASTIVNNTSTGWVGGILSTAGTITMRNSILAGNTGMTGPDCYIQTPASFQSAGYNMVGSTSNCPIATSTGDVTGFSYTSLLLGPLQNNGGPNSTFALLPGSPAIDAVPGCNGAPASDQRGISRPQGTNCDVGAYEAVALLPTVTFDANLGSGTMSPQTGSTPTALTLNAFTRSGYTFAGWGTATGGPVVYNDGDTYNFDADITLYAQWTAIDPPSISKSFGAAAILLNGTTTLSFTITNPNAAVALTGVAFTDSLPAGLRVATPNGLSGSCGGGTISAVAGSGTVSLSGATLPAGTDCTFSVDITGITVSFNSNWTDLVTSTNGGTGNQAGATIQVVALPMLNSFTRQVPADSPTNADALVFRAVFNVDVNNVDTADFTVNGTTTATVIGVADVNARTYDVTVSGGDLASFNGTVGLDLAAGQNIQNLYGYAISAGEPATDETYVVDNATIAVTSILRQDPLTSPTNATSVTFRVTFAEDVQNVDPGDFALASSTATGTINAVVVQSASVYDLVIIGIVGSGLLDLNFASANDIADLSNNPLGAAPSIGTEQTYLIDNSYPTVLFGGSTTPDNGSIIFVGPTQIAVEFNEDVLADGSANAANLAANYLLVEDGTNGAFDTIACGGTGGGLQSDDLRITVNSVTYNNNGSAGPFLATLNINSGISLPIGTYRLFVCGTSSIYDLIGHRLNNGLDSLVNFSVARVAALPDTGFAPGRVTILPDQTVAYMESDLWLEIPRLGVQMDIVGVPLSEDGIWEVSWLGDDAGWLNGTAYPTWNGNSVLTGHVVDANGNAGPFRYLNTLWYGDEIIIHAGGAQYVYAVRSVQVVGPGSIAQFMQHEELPWVTLITCRGYDPVTGEYLYRVLVQAVLVEVH